MARMMPRRTNRFGDDAKAWPEIAARSLKDSAGRSPKYTFFYPKIPSEYYGYNAFRSKPVLIF
jgi:hypothetical protein